MKLGLVAAGAAAMGFAIGKQMGAKGPTGFGARVGAASKKVTTLNPVEARRYIKTKSPLIIDVRDSGDTGNAVAGAINIPLSNLVFMGDQDFALGDDIKVKGETKVPKSTVFCHPKLQGSKDRPILVSCGLGGQALLGAEILVDYGFTEVRAVAGGNMAWMDSDGPVCECARLPVAIMFNGQGAQSVVMLTKVKDMPAVKDMLEKAEKILGYNVMELCENGPEEKLSQTMYCQPVMFIAGLAGLERLRAEQPEKVKKCSAMGGLSLGEYTSLCAAGTLSFEDGLNLVKLRGEAMEAAATASKQLMLSVQGLEKAKLEELCKASAAAEPNGVCTIANSLMPNGYVMGGTMQCINTLKAKCEEAGAAKAMVIKTAGAFHTALMQPAQDKLSAALEQTLPKMKPNKVAVYMNVTSKPMPPGSDPKDIVANLKKQLTSPVLWMDSMNAMISDGVEEFYECGPQKQLKAMMKRINLEVWKETYNIEV